MGFSQVIYNCELMFIVYASAGKNTCENVMDACRDTVLITGLRGDLSGDEFIKAFSSYGDIKTRRDTAQRLAEMKPILDGSEKEGIVTYENEQQAKNAIKDLHGTELGGRRISVKTADSYFYGRMPNDPYVPREFENLAWRLWKEEGLRKDGGGRGGKGGGSSFSGEPGNDGEPGKPGPCGEGGKGGKPAHG